MRRHRSVRAAVVLAWRTMERKYAAGASPSTTGGGFAIETIHPETEAAGRAQTMVRTSSSCEETRSIYIDFFISKTLLAS